MAQNAPNDQCKVNMRASFTANMNNRIYLRIFYDPLLRKGYADKSSIVCKLEGAIRLADQNGAPQQGDDYHLLLFPPAAPPAPATL